MRTTARYRTVQIEAGCQIITAADTLPTDVREAITKIEGAVRNYNVLSRT